MTSRARQSLIALSLAYCLSSACFAGERELVELMEQVAAQFEQLNSANRAYNDLLAQVTDAATAEEVLDQIEPAATRFIREIDAMTPIVERGVKESKSSQVQSPEYQSRAQAVAEKQPLLVQEWQDQASRFAEESNRVNGLKELPARFRDVYREQQRKVRISINRLLRILRQTKPLASVGPGGRSPGGATTDANFGPDWPELDAPEATTVTGIKVRIPTRADVIRKYGRDKVVFLEFTNASELPADRHVARAIQAKGVEFARYRSGHAFAAPVDDIAVFANMLDLGQVIECDETKGVIKIQAAPRKVAAGAGVIWIEIVNADDLRGGSVPRARIARARTPAEKLRVLRESRMGTMANFMSLLRLAAGDPAGWAYQGKENGKAAEVGPIPDFDAFCKNLDFAEITEQDERTRTLKLRVDASRLTAEAVDKKGRR